MSWGSQLAPWTRWENTLVPAKLRLFEKLNLLSSNLRDTPVFRYESKRASASKRYSGPAPRQAGSGKGYEFGLLPVQTHLCKRFYILSTLTFRRAGLTHKARTACRTRCASCVNLRAFTLWCHQSPASWQCYRWAAEEVYRTTLLHRPCNIMGSEGVPVPSLEDGPTLTFNETQGSGSWKPIFCSEVARYGDFEQTRPHNSNCSRFGVWKAPRTRLAQCGPQIMYVRQIYCAMVTGWNIS